MNELDRMIEQALNEDDRAFLARVGREPGYFTQFGGVFSGTLGWLNIVVMATQTALFFGGSWCAWQFFQSDEPLTALRWGLPSIVLLLAAVVLKVATLWPSLQANRILRELKRLELQIVRKGEKV